MRISTASKRIGMSSSQRVIMIATTCTTLLFWVPVCTVGAAGAGAEWTLPASVRHSGSSTAGTTAYAHDQIEKMEFEYDIPRIHVDPPPHHNSHNETTAVPTHEANGTTPSPVPVIPVPTLPPSNHTHQNNDTTPVPTTANNTNTSAPSTIAPSTPTPTVTPTPTPAPTTNAPTVAPTRDHDTKSKSGISFFRTVGKMVAWCILMGLAVLLYGFCINHRYQIAYYARHLGHCCSSCYRWLVFQLRRRRTTTGGYSVLEPHNDAQSLQTLIFDPSMPGNNMFDAEPTNYGNNNDGGFVLGQHSNVNFQSMGGFE